MRYVRSISYNRKVHIEYVSIGTSDEHIITHDPPQPEVQSTLNLSRAYCRTEACFGARRDQADWEEAKQHSIGEARTLVLQERSNKFC